MVASYLLSLGEGLEAGYLLYFVFLRMGNFFYTPTFQITKIKIIRIPNKNYYGNFLTQFVK